MDREPSILSIYASLSPDNPLRNQEVRGTGPIDWIPELNGWRINPSTTFPLTAVNSDQRTAQQIREALDGLASHYRNDVVEVVAAIVTERGARFLEFEQYIEGQRRVYQETLAATRTEGRDAQTDEEVEDGGSEVLDNCCDQTFALLEGAYPADPEQLSLITRFGYANLLSYLRAGPGAVKLVAPAHRNRSGFESLVRSGLALAGDHIAEVPTGALLEALTSDELRKVSTTPIPSKARKKNLAVEFLLPKTAFVAERLR